MTIPICARCHTVLLPSMMSKIIYCPNCDENLSKQDYESTRFEDAPLYAITLVPEYAAELGISFTVADDFQANNLMSMRVACEKTLVQNEYALAQLLVQLSQQLKTESISNSIPCCKIIKTVKERRKIQCLEKTIQTSRASIFHSL